MICGAANFALCPGIMVVCLITPQMRHRPRRHTSVWTTLANLRPSHHKRHCSILAAQTSLTPT